MGLGIGAQQLRTFIRPGQVLHKPKDVPTFCSVRQARLHAYGVA